MRTRRCAVSVDLDEVRHYFEIHGLPADPETRMDAVYALALGRLEALADEHDLSLTLFAIGRDLESPANASRLARLARLGHEIANHSLDHFYDLTRRSPSELFEQVSEANQRIFKAVGQTPRGFRAPGYTVNDALFEALERCGMLYDSSVFPCLPYYAAKASSLGLMKLRRRRSHAILDTPRVLFAPMRPYRVGRPYFRRGTGLLELPIAVTRGLRLPFIGTALTLGGPRMARWLARQMCDQDFINLELHGIDVLSEADGLGALRSHQADVRVPTARKLECLNEALTEIRRAGYEFVRLDQAAAELARAH